MVGPFLREATILIVFCYIFVSGKDILELFQPDPSLPQELNEWLDSVQKHRGDFRYIRDNLALKNKKSLFNLNDDYEDYHKEDKEVNGPRSNNLDTGKVNVDNQPKNDIYPYMYKNINELLDFGKNTLKSLDDNKKVNSKNVKSPIRLRRSPADLNFFDSQNSVNIDSKASSGEIRRADDKYPERFMSNGESNIVESDRKINAENSLADDSNIKREIQIDIKNNGKLVKQIREDDKKSLILHIQSPISAEDKPDGYSEGNLEPTPNSIFEYKIHPSHLSFQEIPLGSNNHPQGAFRGKHSQPNQMNREIESNYLNLFSANDHLTTDRNLLQKNVCTRKEHLVYNIRLPVNSSPPYLTNQYGDIMNDNNNYNKKISSENRQNPNANDFIHNNLQDMSNFWTASDKMLMQKGLDYAYVTDNLRKLTQKKVTQKFRAIKDNETGFEPAQRIELDNDNGKAPPQNSYIGDTAETNSENTPYGYDPLNIENRRQLEAIQDNIKLANNDIGQYLHNLDNVLDNSLSNTGPLNTENIMENRRNNDNNELSLDNTKLTPSKNVFDKFQTLGENNNVVLAGNIMEGNAGLLNSADSANSVESANSAGSIDNVSSAIDSPVKAKLDIGNDKLDKVENSAGKIILEDNSRDQRRELAGKAENVLEPGDNSPENKEESIESNIVNSPEKNRKVFVLAALADNHRIKNNIRKLQMQLRNNRRFTEQDTATEIDYPDIEGEEDEEYEQPDPEILDEPSNINKKHVEESHNQVEDYQQSDDQPDDDNYIDPYKDIRSKAPTAVKYYKHSPNTKVNLTPSSKDIVILSNKTPSELMRAKCYVMRKSGLYSKNAKINCDEDFREPQHYEINWNIGNEKSDNTNPFLPKELNAFMKRRVKTKHAGIQKLKYIKHRNKKSNEKFDLNPFNDLVPNDHESYLNEKSDNLNINFPNIKSDLIPAFMGRQLKSVDYAYDAYLEKPGDDYYEDMSTEFHEETTESGDRDDMLHKKSIEGDYGDEEDSATERDKKYGYNIIKKTDNEYANPRTTTENDEEYYNDNYDDRSFSPKVHKVTTKDVDPRNNKKLFPESSGLSVPEAKYSGIDSFGHHGHHKYKPRFPLRKHHTRSVPLPRREKEKVVEHRDTNAPNGIRNHKTKRRLPRSEYVRNSVISRRAADSKGDFQHWPSFVINDHENEEQLRKRSPRNKYPRYSFPLSVNDFFVKPQKRLSAVGLKREKPSENEKEAIADDNGDKPMECKAVAEKLLAETCTSPKPDFADKFFTSARVVDTVEVVDATEACLKQNLSNVCEENENFNKTTAKMTTILAIIPESELECNNDSTHHILEKLDDVLSGKTGLMLRDRMIDELSDNLKLRNRFNKGIQKTDKTIIHKTLNDTNAETKKLLKAMTRIMERLELTATCQTLPHNLVAYLKSITKVKKEDSLAKTKEMEEVQFDENQNQSNFIFESSDQGENLEGKVKILEDLLDKYSNLPERCKSRALPVKEYIESHLTMLKNMMNGKTQQTPQAKIKKSIEARSDDTWQNEDALIREQLDSLGLGKEHNFKPQFSLRDMIENNKYGRAVTSHDNQVTARPQKVNVNKREIDKHTVSRSKQYNKLVDAVRKQRLRREGERRLGEAFGKSSKESNDYGGFNLDLEHKDNEDMSEANFESPLVYSL